MVKFISVKGVKAIGNRLSPLPVTEVLLEAPNAEKEEATALERQSELADQISEAPDSTSEADSAADVEVEEDSAMQNPRKRNLRKHNLRKQNLRKQNLQALKLRREKSHPKTICQTLQFLMTVKKLVCFDKKR